MIWENETALPFLRVHLNANRNRELLVANYNTPDTLGNDAVSLTASAFGRSSHFLQVSPGPDLEKNDAPFAVTLVMSWFWGLKNVRTIVIIPLQK